MTEALLALGGNIGDVRATFERVLTMLCDDDTRLVARSSDYLTPPWGIVDQPEFVNACLLVDTALSPRALLERTQAIERAFGRDRTHAVHWGPRPIDIDLLAYDDLSVNEPDLTLPHPRLFERAFVLVPLAEIAGDHSIGGRKIADALAAVDASAIKRLPPRLNELV